MRFFALSSQQQKQRLAEIEQNQTALRENIAESKRLIDRSSELIEAHRRALDTENSIN
jgi:hypothetical protein